MLKKLNRSVLLILGLALALRLFGINHGFPFVFHPDEATIIRSALGIRFDINPAHFDWPHLYIYLNYFLYMIFAKVRNIIPTSFSLVWNDEWIFYLLTRILTAIIGAFTIIPIYLTGKKLFGKKAGVLSALAFSIVPFHVWHSHYALTDVPMVFFLSWGLYLSSCLLSSRKVRHYIFAGFFIGLSASTKYNGGLSALMVPLATIFNNLGNKKKVIIISDVKGWILSGIFAILGFLIGTPFALFDFSTFSRTDGPKGALWQFTNVGSVDFITHVRQFFNDLVFKISDDLGYVFLIGFIFVLFLSLYKLFKREVDYKVWFPLIMGVFLIWYISGFEKSRSHYYMISYPFIALGFSYLVKDLKYYIYILLFSIPLLLAVRGSYIFTNGDTRVDLYNWLSTQNKDMPIVYDDRDLEILFKAADITTYDRGFDTLNKYSEMYVILSGDDIPDYLLKKEIEFIPVLKRGPNIKVYRYIQ